MGDLMSQYTVSMIFSTDFYAQNSLFTGESVSFCSMEKFVMYTKKYVLVKKIIYK